MHVFVVLTMAVATAQTGSVPSSTEECSPLKNERSLLSSLLMATGYQDTCVANALDFCSTGQENSHYVSLMEVRVRTIFSLILCQIALKVQLKHSKRDK